MRNLKSLRYESLKLKQIQFNSLCLQFGDWISLKRIEKIIRKSAFDKKIKKPRLKFNPGLALTGVRTTGPRMQKVSRNEKSWRLKSVIQFKESESR